MSHRHRHRGTTLVEALIAVLVLSFGALALVRIGADLRHAADTSRQRAEAVRLGETEFERLRAFATIAASDAARSATDIVPARRDIDASTGSPGSTRFTLERRVATGAFPMARDVTVVVAWRDGAGADQRVVLASIITAADPALVGALALTPDGAPP